MKDTEFSPFLLLTPRLVLLPTPLAVSLPAYRTLYATLHATPEFCSMGFGPHFPARTWSEEQVKEVIEREVDLNWKQFGLGDMAVGLWKGDRTVGTLLSNNETTRLVEGEQWTELVKGDSFWDEVEWVGYAGVRNCIPRLPALNPDDPPFPPWQEMIEIRYGISPSKWGLGLATEAARSIMSWATLERGVRRYVAETQMSNKSSGVLLGKLGFVHSHTDYWQSPEDTLEWHCPVVDA